MTTKPNFLQRYSSSNISVLPSIRQRTQQSQIFLTNPLGTSKLKQSLTLPSLQPLTSSQITLQQTKQAYQTLLQKTNQLKTQIDKIKCEYRQTHRKIKQTKIHLQSQIKKVQTVTSIDFKYLLKNWNNMPRISFQFIQGQLEVQQSQNMEISQVVMKLTNKVNALEDQLG